MQRNISPTPTHFHKAKQLSREGTKMKQRSWGEIRSYGRGGKEWWGLPHRSRRASAVRTCSYERSAVPCRGCILGWPEGDVAGRGDLLQSESSAFKGGGAANTCTHRKFEGKKKNAHLLAVQLRPLWLAPLLLCIGFPRA
jgi:hypothetical protein